MTESHLCDYIRVVETPSDFSLSAKEAAARLAVSVSTLHRYATEGLIRCLQTPSRERRFRPEDVDAFARSMLPDQPAASAQ